MNEWKEYKLGEIGKVVTGKTPSTKVNTFYGGPVPFICIPDLGLEKRVKNSVKKLTLEGVDAVRNMLLPKDAIMVSCIATIGKVGITKIPSVTNQQINSILVDNTKALPDYIYYWFKNEGEKIGVYGGGGSVFNIISKSKFENIPVSIPSLPTQTAIAEILSSLDDKIELNNQINKDLEALAQALFKQWFIDFDFPNENGEPYRSSGGEMVDSELGVIPKGWNTVKVSSLNPILQTGKRPKGGVNGIENGMPSVGAESIKGVGYFDFSKTKYVPVEFAKAMKRGIIKGFELLIYKDGGKPGTFIPHFSVFGEGFPFDEFVINEHIFSLDFNDKSFNAFCYYYFDSSYVKPILEYSGGKAAIPGINQGDINNLCIFSPKVEQVKLFSEIAKSTISTILINCRENVHLSKMRDTLLPKLISGELEVSDIQSNSL